MTSTADPRAARRERTREALKRVSPIALSFFEHAIAAGAALTSDPAAVPMLAHALRELTRILPRFTGLAVSGGRVQYVRDLDRIADLWASVDREGRVLTAEQMAVVEGLIAEHQASRIRAAARGMALARTYVHGVLDQDEPLLEGLAHQWRDVERQVAELTHIRSDGSTGSPDEAREVLERYETVLDQTLADFWDIDELIGRALEPGPSAEALTAAKALPKSIQHWRRLYERLGPEWLPHVIAAGDYDHPPEWVTRAEHAMAWPALDYLERVAEREPNLSAEALLRIPSGIDQFARAQVLAIATTLDAEAVRPLAARARSWVRKHYRNPVITDSAGKLMVRMAQAGLHNEAFAIVGSLLAIRKRRATEGSGRARQLALEPRIGEYEFERMLDKQFPLLVESAPARAVRLLLDTLDKALAGVGDQYWRIWLASVSDARARDGVIQLLVAATYDALLAIATNDPDSAEQLLVDIGQREGTVMRRLELGVLGATMLSAGRLNELYQERGLFDDIEVYHEYAETMAGRWSDLTEHARERIRSWIREGPALEPEQDRREQYLGYWRRRWLAVLENLLPEDWKLEFADLLQQKAPEHPTHVSWTTMWSGSRSPKTVDEVAAMSNDDLVTFLQTWVAPAEHGPEESVSGMASVLAATIANDPVRFLSDLDRFHSLKEPAYVRAIGEGLVQAVRNGQAVDWGRALKHVEMQAEKLSDTHPDDGTAWTAARLLEEAMTTGRETFPLDLRARIFAVIRVLAAHDASSDKTTAELDVGRGIQTVRGTAIETAIHYGLWVAGTVLPEQTEDRLDSGLADLGALVAARIAPGAESDPAVSAVLGIYFSTLVFLDGKWVEKNLDRLMPAPNGDASHDAPWEAYLEFSSLHSKRVYDMLAPRYEDAVRLLAAGPIDEDRALNLGMHALIAYAREWDALGVVARRFFAGAPVAVRARLIQRIGHDLADRESAFSPAVLTRLETLWRERLAGTDNASELESFGLWFASSRFDPSSSVGLLTETLEATEGRIDSADDVAARLRDIAPEHPDQTLDLFERILGALQNPWEATRLEPEGLALVRIGLAHADPNVVQAARRIRDRFGQLGFGSFGDLT